MTTILIVEDERRIASFVAKGLRAAGFVPEVYSTGAEAVEAALQGRGALMLLDVGLPDIDGFEVLERIRGQGVEMPVIMLTARTSVSDRVAGLEGGADDYVPKPFSFEELLARVRLRLREEAPVPGGLTLTRGSLVLDLKSRRVRVGGTIGGSVGPGVYPPGDVHAQSRAGSQPRAAAVGGVGDRLRWRIQRGGCLPVLPASEDRKGSFRDRARHGVPSRVSRETCGGATVGWPPHTPR